MAVILVVEDRSLDREYLVKLLTSQGHRLLESTDGAEALIIIQAERPDLIITNIITPSMDSLEFVQRLQLNPEFEFIPVIFYTASYQTTEAKVIADACDVKYVITKPSEPDLIMNTINAALATKTKKKHNYEIESSDTFGLIAKKLSEKAEELETSSLRLTALIEVGLEFAEQREPLQLLNLTCTSARKMIAAKYAAVGILNGGAEPHYFVVRGSGVDESTQLSAPTFDHGVLKQSLTIRKPQRLKRLQADPHDLGLPKKIHSIHDYMSVPISSSIKQYGLLYFVNKIGGNEFTEYDERMAATLAAQLAVAYENLELFNELNLRARRLQEEVEIRKRFETTLARREDQYKQLIEYSPNAIFIQFEDKIVYANSLTFKMLGAKSPEDIIGKSRFEFMHPDYIDIVKERIAGVMQGKPAPLITEKFIRLDGTIIDVEITSSLCEFEGKPAVQVAMHDVTHYKQTERYLAVQAAVSKTLIETTNTKEMLNKILSTICENLKWDLGQFWIINKEKEILQCVSVWPTDKTNTTELRKLCDQLIYKKGIGLPGRVWETGKPIWIADITKNNHYVPAPWTEKITLKTGCAFPIFYRNEILGIIEFFTREMRSEDSEFINIFYAIGSQIGFTLERQREIEDLKQTLRKKEELLDDHKEKLKIIIANKTIRQYNR